MRVRKSERVREEKLQISSVQCQELWIKNQKAWALIPSLSLASQVSPLNLSLIFLICKMEGIRLYYF